jgi:hypothetical protein
MAVSIHLPYKWSTRDYQEPLWNYVMGGGSRAVGVWHRRSGKDATILNLECCKAHQRVGLYWHMLPTLTQGRKAVWNAIDGQGRRLINQVFPHEIRRTKNERDMLIELKNGSMWQVVGSDNFDSLVGSNPVGVVFSEWSLTDPAAWDYIRPILAENGGFAVFIYTPRGRNHGYRLFRHAEAHPDWFAQVLTVDDTKKPKIGHNGGPPLLDEFDEPLMVPVIGPEAIQEDRDTGMSENRIEQEYYCSFDAEIEGAYYGKQMALVRKEGRVGPLEILADIPIETWWDIGVGDSTSIVFVQPVGSWFHIVDYYENTGEGLPHYASVLADKAKEYGWTYSDHLLPHDVQVREWGTGNTRIETARKHNLKFQRVARMPVEDRIEAVRGNLQWCRFNNTTPVMRLLDCLETYRKEWNEALSVWGDKPVHDWASHGADAFGTGFQARRSTHKGKTYQATTDKDPLGSALAGRR